MNRYRDITDRAVKLLSLRSKKPAQPRVVYGAIAVASALIVAAGAGVALVGDALFSNDPRRVAALWGAVGAATATIIGLLIVPWIRDSLGLTQDVRLLAAASPAHPLLKQLISLAPGTYTHSVAVANLAEAAAETIGADPLLARLGSYYHDIGKIRRPGFFFENQRIGANPHDSSTPMASALIITSHVDDGIAFAKEYKLPNKVIDIIRQHHGTSLVRYFYNKAALGDAEVFEADFRYRGEPPASREAGLVMLADSCEAAVRAIRYPTEDRVAAAVKSVIEERRADEQLAQSHLSRHDLSEIGAIYTRMLVSMYHARCEYPPVQTVPRRTTSADQCNEPSRS